MTGKEQLNPARSLYYGFFSKMFVFSESEDRYSGVKDALEVMIANPLDTNSQEALKEIKEFFESGGDSLFVEEYDEIFHNPESKIVRNTASYYDEQVESGKKRVVVKNFLAKTRIRRDEKHFRETEDSVGFLVTFMHELIELIISGEKSYETLQHCLFVEVINEFIDEFIEELYNHPKANAYKSVAVVFNAFIEFERLYFDVAKPKLKLKPVKKESEGCEFISDEEAKRRAENRAKRAADSLVNACAIEDEAFGGKEEEGDL